ncbi:NINE protein [Malonomonas rubra]|nr:NINE protein [Malonomonas rubra]
MPIGGSAVPAGRLPLLLITLLLGGAGGHKIYLKKYLHAGLYALFFWTGIPSVIALVEFVRSAIKPDDEFNSTYQAPEKKIYYASIGVPLLVMLLWLTLLLMLPGFGSVESYDQRAADDVAGCRNSLEGYYAQHRMFPQSAEELVAAGCRSSENVALFVLPKEQHYVIVSYHHQGSKAYLQSRATSDLQELEKQVAVDELNSAFKVVGEREGVTLISQ